LPQSKIGDAASARYRRTALAWRFCFVLTRGYHVTRVAAKQEWRRGINWLALIRLGMVVVMVMRVIMMRVRI
jgi:hypothetical protein